MTIDATQGQPTAPAGWHPDPQTPGQQRYWDGHAWTEHTSPGVAGGPTVQPSPTYAAGAAPAAAVNVNYVAPRGPNGEELASVGARIGARLLDMIALGVIGFVIGSLGLIGAVEDPGLGSFAGMLALVAGMALAGILYEVVFIAVKGQTPGKMLCGVQIVKSRAGEMPGFGSAFLRWLLPAVMFIIPVLGWILGVLTWLSPLFDDRRRGWHDKAADTIAVRTKPGLNF